MSAASPDAPRETAAQAASRWWIQGGWQDLLLFIGTPLLIIPLMWLARSRLSIEQISLYVVAFGATGHHLPGLLRAYGDRELFQRYRVRFILAPLFLLAVCMAFAHYNLGGLIVVLLLWGFWHGMMQVYGFGRIYDAKVKSFSPVTQRLDWAMCAAWFGAGLFLSPSRMEHLLREFYESGGPLLSPSLIQSIETFWIAALIVVTTLFTINYVYQTFWGQPPNPIKLLLMISSFSFWWYAMVFVNNALLGVALFEIFHDVQYLAIVWFFNSKRVEAGKPVGSFTRFLFRRNWALIGLYAGLVFAYGGINLIAENINPETSRNMALTLFGYLGASSLLHFYYDGFIWKVRERDTREGLGLDTATGDVPMFRRPLPGWFLHGAKWAFFVIPIAYLGFAQLSLQAKDSQPLERYINLTQVTPDAWKAHAILGEALSKAKRFEDAIAAHRRAVDLNPTDALVRANLGNDLLRLNQLDEAVAQFQKALELQPDLVDAKLGLARVLFFNQKTQDAMQMFQQVLKNNPDNEDAHLGMAKVMSIVGDYEKALLHYNRAIEIAPTFAEALYSRGRLRAESGEYDLALEDFNAAIRLDPNAAEMYNSRGTVYLRRGQSQDAIADYSKAVELNPMLTKAYRNRATAWTQLGEFEKAVEDFTAAIAFEPEFSDNHSARGAMHYQLGRYQLAIADMQRAVSLDAENYVAYQGLAVILATCPDASCRNGRMAVEAAKRACQLTDYRTSSALETLAAAHAEAGDFEEAVRWQLQAIEMMPPQARLEKDPRLELYRKNQPLRKDPVAERLAILDGNPAP